MSPRSTEQNEKLRAESIKRILNAAFRLMAINGYESTSISQIAREAGVSKGLMYNYFDSKEDLLKGLIQDAVSQADELMSGISDDDPKQTLENLFRWFFDELRNNIEVWRLITELTMKIDKFPFVQEVAMAKINEYVRFVSHLLHQIGVPNPKEEAQLIAALFDGIGVQTIAIKDKYPIEQMEKYLIEKYCKV